jgi:hypothetical protein
MSFFDSEIVQNEAREIMNLQDSLLFLIPRMPQLEKAELLNLFDSMILLLEKQKIFYTRMELSDDIDAQTFRSDLISAASMFGVAPEGKTLNNLYDDFISKMEEMKARAQQGNLNF